VLLSIFASIALLLARDPLACAIVIAVLGIVGLAACVWPAIRAARVNPLTALRAD
jgi:ABC-type antimicrobial peptide transport system permease subunit